MRKHRQGSDYFLNTMRQVHQSHFPPLPAFRFLQRNAWKLWKLSKGFLRYCRESFIFQERLNILHNSQSSPPAVISFSIRSFQFFCLGCNPMIGLRLWSATNTLKSHQVLWFRQIRGQSIVGCFFSNLKIQYMSLWCATYRPDTALILFSSSSSQLIHASMFDWKAAFAINLGWYIY